jgi:ferric-dicitrate binding protein FerR (iron transport regulator)
MNPQNSKNYIHFNTTDFVQDEYFQRWVLNSDESVENFWKDWTLLNPSKATQIAEAKIIVKSLSFKKFALKDSEFSGLWEKIQRHETEAVESSGTTGSVKFYYKIAAFLVLGASLVFAFSKLSSPQYLEYHTAYGETKTISLPDSSTVILNSNSTLKFSENWQSNDTRELWLDGEAYFSVLHKVNHQPFRVYTEEGMSVEVLGTTFNVYHRTDETKVMLNSGKIKLHLPSQSAAENIIMKPGEFVEYKQKTFSKRMVNPRTYTAWTEKKLILDHTSLREMVEMLRDNYGVEVTVSDDSLLSQTVSGSMPISDVRSLVLQIAQTFQLKVEEQNNKFLMHE